MRSLVLYRIIVLILFLDQAKTANVLDKVPRLFAKGSKVKSSREVLLAFCRACLSSEGDFIKHLSRIGLTVTYKQDPVDELDFHIKNLATDLRDGTRLSRVTEIITQIPAKSLMSKLRLPSISRLQKLHNLNLALSSLRDFGVLMPQDVNAHHIADGHRDMVLKVMWSLIAHSCMEKLLKGDLVEQEIASVVRSNQARRKLKGLVAKDKEDHLYQPPKPFPNKSPEQVLKSLLFRWCQAICSSFDLKLVDFSNSFSDGKALCLLVHYYHPGVIRLDEILPTSNDYVEGLPMEQAIKNERANSTMASRRASQLGGIPKMIPYCDTKNPPNERSMLLCLTYLCSRLMESSREIFATILIQQCYRKYKSKVLLEKKQEAAWIIFQFWCEHKEDYFRSQKRCYSRAVAVVEDFVIQHWHSLLRMKRIRLEKEHRSSAAIQIQVSRVL
jgi:abnormal spindle-like microcephaly-associated protein